MPQNKLPFDISKPVSRSFAMDVRDGNVDIEKRTVEVAFSSDTPVERSWGYEVLDHGPGSIVMDRLIRGAPVLMDHDPKDHVGVVDSVRIGTDQVGRARLRFGKGARASEVFQDVQDEIRTNISVGYRILEAVNDGERDGLPVIRVTRWQPHEITFTSIPADINTGVGRSADPPNPKPEIKIMPTEKTPEQLVEEARLAGEQRAKDAARGATEAEQKRVADILTVRDKYAKYNVAKLADEAVRKQHTIDQFTADILAHIATNPTRTDASIGLTEKETQRYSLVRALAALASPRDIRMQESAAFEFECSKAAIDKGFASRKGGSFVVPHEILKRQMPMSDKQMRKLVQRALSVGTASAGGYTVATDLLASDFISLLRNAMVITGMGTRVLTGLQGNVEIPKQTGGATAYWVGEASDTTESDQAFAQVPLTPKTVGTYTDMSRRLLMQSSIDIESLVQSDLAMVMGLAIQSAAIKGGGSNEPSGILSTGGIGSVAGGTNGLAPTWANIVALETAVAVANADVGTLGYLSNAKVRGALKTTQKFAGAPGNPIWDGGATPVNGYRVGVTNAVPSNGTKGTGTNLSSIIFGNFADLLIGMWGGLDILVDPYSNSKSGSVRVRILQDCDIAVRHAESFAAMTDAIA